MRKHATARAGSSLRRTLLAVAAGTCASMLSACSGGGEDSSPTSVRFSTSSMESTPFPSDRFTVPDTTQNTLLRVALPKPDCSVAASDCSDIDVINTLDGFSTQPRIAIPFTGAIDPATVSSDTVFLVRVGDPRTGAGSGERVGINQSVWDPATSTLFVQSDQLLAEHSQYLLVITDGLRDPQGRRLSRGAWRDPITGLAAGTDSSAYSNALHAAMRLVPASANPIAASLFTTRSATGELARIQQAIHASTPAPVDFMIGTQAGAAVRASFGRTAVSGIRFDRDSTTAPGLASSQLPMASLDLRGSVIGTIAYGRYRSPRYLNANYFIPATQTLQGVPQPQTTSDIVVQVFLPAGTRPTAGWPVMIFGHGFGDSMYGAPWSVASSLAAKGIATIAINVMGHGGGPLGTLQVSLAGGQQITVPAGGRSEDVNGDGSYAATEGASARAPYAAMIASRDGMRQTVADLFQLVRQVQAGIDVDGDGSVDLDASHIYYSGQSFGGIYGGMFTAVEPGIRAYVLNVAGGSLVETTRLGGFRSVRTADLASRTPSLVNLPSGQFDENIPLRNQPILVNDVPGALAIQQVFDRAQWVQQSGNVVSYAPLMRKLPLAGVPARPLLLQNAKGDQQAPNPTSTAILRAGGLADRELFYRYDLVYAQNPGLPKDPHTFLTAITNPVTLPYALAAQDQIATFFASEGQAVVDPDGAGAIFEMPIVPPLPETVNFMQ